MRLCRVLGLSMSLLGGLSGSVFASWQTDQFVKSIEKSGDQFKFEFWLRGIDSVINVSFRNDSTEKFQPLWNTIVLGTSYDDGAQRIRKWDQLSPINLGILAHESFHAYIHNFIFYEREWKPEKDWMTSRAVVLFHELPRSKALVAMEEAYASFIGNVVTAARTIQKALERNSQASCLQSYLLFKSIWERTWNDPVRGYYDRDGLVEYYSDRMKWIVHRVSGSEEEIRLGEPIFTERSITDVDRNWISRTLFEGKFLSSFDKSFPEISAELKTCISQEESDLIEEIQDL